MTHSQEIEVQSASLGNTSVVELSLTLVLLFLFSAVTMFWLKAFYHLSNISDPCYFSHLAWSFLHYRLDLVGFSPKSIDLSFFNGRVYAYWPPLSAICMMPFVWLRGGPLLFPQRVFGILVAAGAVPLIYLLILRFDGLTERCSTRAERVMTTVFFAFGTSNLIFGVVALHWFIGQLTASLALLAAILLMLDAAQNSPTKTLFAGLCFSFAVLGRANLLLTFPSWLLLGWASTLTRPPLRLRRPPAAFFVAVATAVGGAIGLCWYNYTRFGSFFEFGISYNRMAEMFKTDFARHGYTSLCYLPRNIYFELIRLPGMQLIDRRDAWLGFSIFAQCPIFLGLFAPLRRKRDVCLAAVLGMGAFLAVVSSLLILGTGWRQFGSRYFYDAVPFLIPLLRLKQIRTGWWIGLGIVSIVINIYGIGWFVPVG